MRFLPFLLLSLLFLFSCKNNEKTALPPDGLTQTDSLKKDSLKVVANLDTADYDLRQKALANGDTTGRWPVKDDVYPLNGAILPFQRVVAYYGNFYSKRMGILGELPEDEMLDSLEAEVKKWEAADTTTPVQRALHYIAVTAQTQPGKGKTYRMRMPVAQIEKALTIAKKADAIVFLDIQVGHSTLAAEMAALDTFLRMPNVHLGIDPEFSMKSGKRPGTQIGTFDADDVNEAAAYLAGLVKMYNLPPKILVVHCFTKPMMTDYEDIQLRPEVQVVVHMDGWGWPGKKKGTYRHVIFPQPVQFTGFKVFYKNDTEKVDWDEEMQPADILQLVLKPIYIQYQ